MTHQGIRPRLHVLAVLAMALAGCSGGGNTDAGKGTAATSGSSGKGGAAPIKLLFITNSNADWWNAVEKGIIDGGQEFGCKVELKRNEGTVAGQIERLNEALSLTDVQGVGLSVLEADAPGIIDAMKALQKAGKVVVVIDSDVNPKAEDARSGYIGTRNLYAGEVAGRAAANIRPQGGNVAVFVGTSAALNAKERQEGFFKGAGEKFKRVETFDDGNDPARVRSNVQTAIGKYPDLGVLLGLWSYNAPAIAEEVAGNPAFRKKASIVTFDLDEAAVVELEKGNIDATVCQNPWEMGYLGVKLLKALVNKDDKTVKDVLPDGKVRETKVRVIVKDANSPAMKGKTAGDDVITIDEMKSWMAGKGLKSS